MVVNRALKYPGTRSLLVSGSHKHHSHGSQNSAESKHLAELRATGEDGAVQLLIISRDNIWRTIFHGARSL